MVSLHPKFTAKVWSVKVIKFVNLKTGTDYQHALALLCLTEYGWKVEYFAQNFTKL